MPSASIIYNGREAPSYLSPSTPGSIGRAILLLQIIVVDLDLDPSCEVSVSTPSGVREQMLQPIISILGALTLRLLFFIHSM
jgi:hypothetical protein